jgi:hypothetical protein
MDYKEWTEMIERNYDEISEKLEEAYELAKEKPWGLVDVIMNQDGEVYLDEEANIDTMAGDVWSGEAIYIARLDSEGIDEVTEVYLDETIQRKLDELNF